VHSKERVSLTGCAHPATAWRRVSMSRQKKPAEQERGRLNIQEVGPPGAVFLREPLRSCDGPHRHGFSIGGPADGIGSAASMNHMLAGQGGNSLSCQIASSRKDDLHSYKFDLRLTCCTSLRQKRRDDERHDPDWERHGSAQPHLF
jgi:hypothetical protein